MLFLLLGRESIDRLAWNFPHASTYTSTASTIRSSQTNTVKRNAGENVNLRSVYTP